MINSVFGTVDARCKHEDLHSLFVYLGHTLIFRSVIPLVPQIQLKVEVCLQFIRLTGKAMGWRNGESVFRRNRCLHLYGSTLKI
jgi:hypothetical protein